MATFRHSSANSGGTIEKAPKLCFLNKTNKNSSKTKKQIDAHIISIKEQKLTQIFYLPKIKGQIEDSIIFLDRVNSCPIELLKTKELKNERLFTLSDYGAYLFVFKLSIHFTRIKDNVDRFSGIIH